VAAAQTLALSLISHTNVGKTTLARTLLGRDIGEVRDAAHVTLEAERHLLVETEGGDRLELWDTPGLGDSVRLARRLAQQRHPIGWFVAEVWDRFRDRAFWSSQRAVRNILEQADVVLYLVNASEAPEDIGYLDAELRVLDLIGKPVVVLLNQLGPPRPAAQDAAEVERWRARVRAAHGVRDVLAFDAFARCWVQEDTLLAAIAGALDAARRAAFERLRAEWQARNRARFDTAMRVLADSLVRAAQDREVVHDEGWAGRVAGVGREIGARLGTLIGLRRDGVATPREAAMEELARRLDENIRASTARLIGLHSLEGEATGIVLARLAEHYAVREPLSEGKAAVLGGVVAGAIAGLKADIASGGLTLGGGLLAGGVLGALGAAGATRGFNLVRGVDRPVLMWSDAVLEQLVRSALLTYLAVAHCGRGRGEWAEAERPAFWKERIDAALQRHGTLPWRAARAARAPDADAAAGAEPSAGQANATRALAAALSGVVADVLAELYPTALIRAP
jgi:hypothetical protein